jgi:hypothetical protein
MGRRAQEKHADAGTHRDTATAGRRVILAISALLFAGATVGFAGDRASGQHDRPATMHHDNGSTLAFWRTPG